jgi:type IV secretion system protein TrbC
MTQPERCCTRASMTARHSCLTGTHASSTRRRIVVAAVGTAVGAGVVLALLLWMPPALAQSGAAPWEGPICVIARSLSGPVAKAVAVIAIVITGLMIAFGELGGVFKSLLGLVFGISFALLADQWLGFIRAGAATSCFGG